MLAELLPIIVRMLNMGNANWAWRITHARAWGIAECNISEPVDEPQAPVKFLVEFDQDKLILIVQHSQRFLVDCVVNKKDCS